MIPATCKRLAEVDFPIAEVSRRAAREESIRHGHPSTLHLWWARRPLASSRAMLIALLLPDPRGGAARGAPWSEIDLEARVRRIRAWRTRRDPSSAYRFPNRHSPYSLGRGNSKWLRLGVSFVVAERQGNFRRDADETAEDDRTRRTRDRARIPQQFPRLGWGMHRQSSRRHETEPRAPCRKKRRASLCTI